MFENEFRHGLQIRAIGISTPVAIQFGKGIGRINIIQNIGPKSTIEILESWFR